MKLFVGLYQRKFEGAPLSELDTTYQDIESTDNNEETMNLLTDAVIELISSNTEMFRDPGFETLVMDNRITTINDFNSINAYAISNGLVFLAGFTNADVSGVDEDQVDNITRIIFSVPTGNVLPILEPAEINQSESVSSISQAATSLMYKYNLNSSLVPSNDLTNLLTSINELVEKGLPVSDSYGNLILNKLSEHGVLTYIVY